MDTRRAITQCFSVIRDFPLEVYNSMLIWLPKSSRIKDKYSNLHQSLKWRVTRGIPHSWSACENILRGHSSLVNSVAFSHDGRRVVSGSSDKTVRIWNVETGSEEKMLEGHSSWVNSVAFSHDGRRVVSGSSDNTVRIWNVETGSEEKMLEGHSDPVNSVAFSHDGKRVVSGSDDKTVWIWNVDVGG